jgi:23S rRNA (pseudouridine1915-N3)-methyltransferase
VLSIAILAGGRGKSAPEQALAADYLAKARDHGRTLGFSGFALTEVDDRKIGAAIAQSPYPILLDETGKARTSTDFAQWLATLRDQGHPSIAFVIGGADGFTKQDRAHAKASIALGPQTWPHLLVRAMMAEQLYRAMTILSGHPYHRDGAR